MGYTNTAIVLGKIVSEIDVKTNDSLKYCRFQIVTKRNDETVYHNIACKDEVVENLIKYCKKGSLIYVCGRIENYKYIGKDGKNKYWSEIVANDIQYCGDQE